MIAFACQLIIPSLFPFLKLFFFAPFLVILYYQKPLITCLWGSFLCGLAIDLLASGSFFGLHALNYVFTTCILYERRQNFFGDSNSTLPIMVFFFSVLSTLLQALLIYVFEKQFSLSWKWVMADGVTMPLLDALYAFIIFVFPLALIGKRPRRGREYFSS